MLFLLQVASELMNDHLTFHTDFPSFSLLPFCLVCRHTSNTSPQSAYRSIPLNHKTSEPRPPVVAVICVQQELVRLYISHLLASSCEYIIPLP